jgi:hypothetical protein
LNQIKTTKQMQQILTAIPQAYKDKEAATAKLKTLVDEEMALYDINETKKKSNFIDEERSRIAFLTADQEEKRVQTTANLMKIRGVGEAQIAQYLALQYQYNEKIVGGAEEQSKKEDIINKQLETKAKLEQELLRTKEQGEIDIALATAKTSGVFTRTEELRLEMAMLATSKDIAQQEVIRLKIIDLQKQVIIEQLTEIEKISSALSDSFQGGLEGFLKGTTSLKGMFADFGKEIQNTFISQAAGGITKNLFNSTGIGNMLGIGGVTLKRTLAGSMEEGGYRAGKIIAAHMVGAASNISGGTLIGGETATASWNGSQMVYGGGGSGVTLPGFGQGGWWNQPVGGANNGSYTTIPGMGGNYVDPRTSGASKRGGTLSRGQLAGAAVGGTLTGYSQYQAAQAGGIPQGQAIASGVMTGVGSTMLTVAAMNAWNPVGWILGAALLIGGILGGSLGGKKSKQESSSSQTTENKVASKIDVTNKNLEVINRNLVAMRQDLTYIFPSSAYFSEKRSIDDVFSISAKRGLQ